MKVVGIMSGTSLDGVDLALVEFEGVQTISFQILAAVTVPYPDVWSKRLKTCNGLSAEEFLKLHNEYGNYLGDLCKVFIKKNNSEAEVIASHGHTIFHQPDNRFTFQLGSGACIAATTGVTTVSDFRSLDVALGGQGAPLVPIGDRLLFGEYDYCLNLGGFGNISFEKTGERIAFDCCPVNMILNLLANERGFDFDKNGNLSASGSFNQELFDNLNRIKFYHQSYPKSLGAEWFKSEFLPLIEQSKITLEDKLHTLCHHIAYQVSKCLLLKHTDHSKMLVTGGGARNTFLQQLMKQYCSVQIIIPEERIVDFKEALIFAFLGYLRIAEMPNSLSSVTGAASNSTGGSVFVMK